MKKILLLFTSLFFILCLTGCNQKPETSTTNDITKHEQPENLPEEGYINNPDGSRTIGEGFISNGFRDSTTDKIIDCGTILKPVDGKIKGYIDFTQNLPEKKEYLLILMTDFIQQSFQSNGIEYQAYPFSLEGYESIKINIELPFPEDAKEFCYLIVFNPNMKEFTTADEYIWDNIYESMQCLSGRFLLNEFIYQENEYPFDENFTVQNKSLDLICDLVKDLNIFMIMPSCNSGEKIYLALGDDGIEYSDTCAVVAFYNWEQIPITDDEELYKLVKLKKDKILSYEITVPNVNEPTPYQIFVFPSPFIQEKLEYSLVNATPRTIINNRQ